MANRRGEVGWFPVVKGHRLWFLVGAGREGGLIGSGWELLWFCLIITSGFKEKDVDFMLYFFSFITVFTYTDCIQLVIVLV